MWISIRRSLEERGGVVLHDVARGEMTAFRANLLGKVEKEVRPLMRARIKRGMPLFTSSSGSSSQPPFSMEDVVNNGRGLLVPTDLTRTPNGEAGKDARYAHLRHFNGFPGFDIDHAHARDLQQGLVDYDWIYVYGRKRGARSPTIVLLSRDQRLHDPAPSHASFLQTIQNTRNLEEQWGPQVRALTDGRPITRARQVGTVRTFFTGRRLGPLNLHEMRAALSDAGMIKIVDQDSRQGISLMLNRRGFAESASLHPGAVTRMLSEYAHHGIRKRDEDGLNDVAARSLVEANGEQASKLVKRGMPLAESPGTPAPRPQTMEFVLNHGQGLSIMSGLEHTPGGEEGLDQRYASILHFRGLPVYNVHQTATFTLEQALVDYGSIYVYGIKQGSSRRSVVQLFRDRPPVDPAAPSNVLLPVIAQSQQLEERRGPLLRALVDGRPIRPIRPLVDQDIHLFRGRSEPPLDLRAIRHGLKTTGKVTIWDRDAADHIYLTLNSRGLADVVSEFPAGLSRSPHVLRKRSVETSGDADANLSKRMLDTQQSQDAYERFLYQFVPRGRQPPTQPERMDAVWADRLHYQGAPVIFANAAPYDDQVEIARQALADRGSFWVIGSHRGTRDEPIPAFQRLRNGVISKDDQEFALTLMDEAKSFGQAHGELAKKLAYGPPFTPRKSRWYETPSWDDVWYKAETVDADHGALLEARAKLARDDMLKIRTSTGSIIGYALNEDGSVLAKVLQAGRRLEKRMFRSNNGGVQPYEYYLQGHFMANRDRVPIDADAAKRHLDHVVFHRGVPVLHATTTPEFVAHHAMNRHEGFWLLGRPSYAPSGSLQYTRLRNDRGVGSEGWDDVQRRLQSADEMGIRLGEHAKLLVYGRPFATRPKRNLFSEYTRPSWIKCEQGQHSSIWQKSALTLEPCATCLTRAT